MGIMSRKVYYIMTNMSIHTGRVGCIFVILPGTLFIYRKKYMITWIIYDLKMREKVKEKRAKINYQIWCNYIYLPSASF